MNEREFVDLVERHRQEQSMSLPHPDLLADAHAERRRRRRRATAATAAVLAGVVLFSGAVHVVRAVVRDSPAAAGPQAPPPWAQHPTGPSAGSRLVGSNGWAVRVPAGWGTDRVACDGVTAARPSVLFSDLLTAGPSCRTGPPTLFVRIGHESFAGAPWRTVSGTAVVRRRHVCAVCAHLRVPSAGVSFEIRANNSAFLHRIEDSLQPVGPRQATVPIVAATRPADAPLDQMVTIATGLGLRPRVLEVPSRLAPGTFLRSDPPIGTPVDLGRSISLFFSAGDLGRYATTRSLSRHGWRIFPVAVPTAAYRRTAALAVVFGHGGVQVSRHHPTFLRTLTITHEGPRRVVVRRRLVWLVLTPTVRGSRQGAGAIVAVDATTGRVIEAQSDFSGRVTTAVR